MIEDKYGLTFKLNELTKGDVPGIFKYMDVCIVKYYITGFEYNTPIIVKDSEGNVVEIKVYLTSVDDLTNITDDILKFRD